MSKFRHGIGLPRAKAQKTGSTLILNYSASLKSKPILVTLHRDIILAGISRDCLTLTVSLEGRQRRARHFSRLI